MACYATNDECGDESVLYGLAMIIWGGSALSILLVVAACRFSSSVRDQLWGADSAESGTEGNEEQPDKP